ncbi:hypothetical protein [Subtercola boreus]|uniref:Uncharacterized protein n=1 Tax=Subtercola boreus TaxID=120213 RepID=A0A3E0WAX8_9MICO|nr:hypothetical protein [Subtercola boreus]RFA21236.1 hypothetical protein B7R24_07590 [Subtercola boreus]RFA21619.1 hypothetical protein B7R23_07535 [Subtercola boreus]RFA27589.1 hypothetical protein B7R25_07660 [Subtercola boreus]
MTLTEYDLTERLRSLDPSPEPTLSQGDRRHLDETLLRITTATVEAPTRRPRRRRLAVGAFGVLSVAAVAATLVVSINSPSQAPVSNFALSAKGALASYTTTPVPVPPSAADRNACGTASSEHGNTSTEAVLTSEQRGDFRAMMFADGDTHTAFCIVAGDSALWISNAEYLSTAPPEDLQLEPAPSADEITTDLGRMDSPSDEFGIITSMSGRAGDDVTSVTLALHDGRVVDASVNNGSWSAWWPSTIDAAVDADFPDRTTYTTVDGVEHDGPAFGG